ncbi:MAG: hypothetical protein GXO03_02865 [Aquificae bacterium]|nr:hypothetical protein [Aquificota bacterium]
MGLGGTITTVAALELGLYPYEGKKVHGTRLTLESLERWFNELVKLPSEERKKRYRQIEDRRARVLPAGILAFVELMKTLKRDEITVSDWGLREGLLVELLTSSRER